MPSSAFRLAYVAFYCQLRRVLRVKANATGVNTTFSLLDRFHLTVAPDPYGMCPRVCSDRSGMIAEEGEAEVTNSDDLEPVRPEQRMEQCVPPAGLTTVDSAKCHPSEAGRIKHIMSTNN